VVVLRASSLVVQDQAVKVVKAGLGLLADQLVAALKAVERVAQPAKVAPLVRRLPKPAVLRPCAVASRPRQGRPHRGLMV
jgi:hypothetical protein